MSIDDLKQVLALGREYSAASIHWGSCQVTFKDLPESQPPAVEAIQSPAPALAADDTSNTDEIRFWSSSDSSVPLAGDE